MKRLKTNLKGAACPEEVLINVKANLSRNVPPLSHMDEPNGETVCVVSNGPTLEQTWPEVAKLRLLGAKVWACNGAIKFLMDHRILPDVGVVMHPTETVVDRVEAHPDIEYFLAGMCAPGVYAKVLRAGAKVKMWHTNVMDDIRLHLPEGHWRLSDGPTVGASAVTLALSQGYSDIHVFGLDACCGEDRIYAGEPVTKTERIIPVQCGDGRWFRTKPGHIDQVRYIRHTLQIAPPDRRIRFWGDGFLQHFIRTAQQTQETKDAA